MEIRNANSTSATLIAASTSGLITKSILDIPTCSNSRLAMGLIAMVDTTHHVSYTHLMIHKKWLAALLCLYCLAGGILASSVLKQTPPPIDMVAVNRIVNHTLEQFENQDFSKMPGAPYDYTVLDTAGNVLFQTSPQAPSAISEAIRAHDAVLDVTDTDKNLQPYGKVLISTNYESFLALQQRRPTKLVLLMFALLLLMALCYTFYLNRMVFTLSLIHI